MKNCLIVCIAALMCAPLALQGKTDGFLGFYKKYQGKDDFVSMTIPAPLVKPFLISGDRDVRRLMKHVRNVKVMVYDGRKESVSRLEQELKEHYLSSWYDNLMTVNSQGDNVEFEIRRNGDKVNELLLLVVEDYELVVLDVYGKIDLKDVRKLAGSISLKGLKGGANSED